MSAPRQATNSASKALQLEPLKLESYQHSGLTHDEVATRVALGLTNIQSSVSSRSLTHILRSNLLTLFNAVVGGAFLLLLLLGQWQDALFGIPVIVNLVVGIGQELRSKRVLDRLSILDSPRARVIRNGEVVDIDVADLVLDDLLVLKAGDQITADATTLQATNFSVDESLVSGEAEPIEKSNQEELISGSLVISGTAKARVSKVGFETFAGKMNLEARRYSLANSEIRKALNQVILWISILLLPLSLLVTNGQISAFGGWEKFLSGENQLEVLVAAIASIVSMVPQGLVLISSISFALAAIRLARRDVLTQELPAVETLARVDVICFDKTGTLTTSNLSVNDFEVINQSEPAKLDWKSVLSVFAHDSDANQSAKAMASSVNVINTLEADAKVPFDSARRWSGFSFLTEARQIESWVLGAPENLLENPANALTLERAQSLAELGFRVLVLCSSAQELNANTQLPSDLTPRVLISLREEIRNEAAQTLRFFEEQEIQIRIISGDNPLTVAGIAQACGLEKLGRDESSTAFDARFLPENDQELAELLERVYVFGRVSPDQKRRMISALQAKGHVVAMAGDGVNDALALKQADLGIAMGSGSSATKAIAKLVLLGGDFEAVPKIVAEGRRVIANIERVASLFLTKTIWAMLLALGFGLLSWKFAFIPRQITAMDLFIIGIPSFALALLPNTKRYQSGLLPRTLRFSIPSGLAMAAMVFIFLSLSTNHLDSSAEGIMKQQTSVILLLSIASLWVVNILSRPLRGMRSLIVLSCYLMFSIIFLVPEISAFFGFRQLSLTELMLPISLGLVCCFAVELVHRLNTRLRS